MFKIIIRFASFFLFFIVCPFFLFSTPICINSQQYKKSLLIGLEPNHKILHSYVSYSLAPIITIVKDPRFSGTLQYGSNLSYGYVMNIKGRLSLEARAILRQISGMVLANGVAYKGYVGTGLSLGFTHFFSPVNHGHGYRVPNIKTEMDNTYLDGNVLSLFSRNTKKKLAEKIFGFSLVGNAFFCNYDYTDTLFFYPEAIIDGLMAFPLKNSAGILMVKIPLGIQFRKDLEYAFLLGLNISWSYKNSISNLLQH